MLVLVPPNGQEPVARLRGHLRLPDIEGLPPVPRQPEMSGVWRAARGRVGPLTVVLAATMSPAAVETASQAGNCQLSRGTTTRPESQTSPLLRSLAR